MVLDTSIRLRRSTKKRLDRLNFVRKNSSYNDIIMELVEHYNIQKRKKNEIKLLQD